MITFISILRGINVSGQKKILMADLKKLYEELHLENVETYIQSGNVVFDADEKNTCIQLAEQIKDKIFEKYRFEVPVIVRTASEMRKTLNSNPFLSKSNIDQEKLHITFLADEPAKEFLEKIKTIAYPSDRFVISGKDIFLYCPNGYGVTKLSNQFFESRFNVPATTRNLKTVKQLVAIAAGR
jgi:uncharacterized protein (DUF1697 family)